MRRLLLQIHERDGTGSPEGVVVEQDEFEFDGRHNVDRGGHLE
jgi:hypothetical protein